MLPEVQILSITWPRGARRRHETSASASTTSETLALCTIGKQYGVITPHERRTGSVPSQLSISRTDSFGLN